MPNHLLQFCLDLADKNLYFTVIKLYVGRPVTLNVSSTSHQSKLVTSLVHILPFWLRRLGVTLTFSALAMA